MAIQGYVVFCATFSLLALLNMIVLFPFVKIKISEHSGLQNGVENDVVHSSLTIFNSAHGYKSDVQRDVVVMLIRGFPRTLIIQQLVMLDRALDDGFRADFVVFHDDYPMTWDMDEVRRNTKRNVDFVNIERVMIRPSEHVGFDPYEQDPNWRKGGKWSYHQMCRFWFADIFKLHVMQNVRYFLRIDDDSILLNSGKNGDIFANMNSRGLTYIGNELVTEYAPVATNMTAFALDYATFNGISIQNMPLWKGFFSPDITHYYNNFEVVSMAFFQRPEVRMWTKHVLKSGFIYQHRWGDASLRTATLAMFCVPDKIANRSDLGIEYSHPGSGRFFELTADEVAHRQSRTASRSVFGSDGVSA